MTTSHVKLSDIASISKGLSYKGEYLDKPGPKLIGIGAISRVDGLVHKKARYYGGPFKPDHQVRTDDILIALTDITQTGDTLGSVARANGRLGASIFSHHVGAIRLHAKSNVSSDFLYYFLQGQRARAHFSSMATGTTVRAVSARDAGALSLAVPPVAEQKRTTKLLTPIDGKLAINGQLQTALHELLLAVFRKMMFPRDTNCDCVLADFVDLDPRTTIAKGSSNIFVDMKSIPTSSPIVLSTRERPYSGGAKFRQGDTLLARITPCLENGKAALVDFLADKETGTGSTELIVMRPHAATSIYWPYCIVRQHEFRQFAIARMTGSSGRQRVAASALADFPLAPIRPSCMKKFDFIAGRIHTKLAALAAENRKLVELREGLVNHFFN